MKRTKEEYEEAIKKSLSIAQVCRELGIKPIGGNYRVIHQKIKEYNLDISHFTGKAWNQGKRYRLINKPKPLEEILKENSFYNSHKLKQRLIESGLKEHKCENPNCGLTEWLGKPITLELHHINGDHNDNRLENLQLLCPNCHSYTDTYRAKNKIRYEKNKKENIILLNEKDLEKIKNISNKEKIEKPKRYCALCGKELNRKQINFCSNACATQSYRKRIDKEELINALEANNYNLTKVGKIYNVSANSIKKWCKHYKIVKDNFFHTKKIQQYDLNNSFIQEFNSITEAMNRTNVTSIKKCLQGKTQSAGGFIWRYVNDENNS